VRSMLKKWFFGKDVCERWGINGPDLVETVLSGELQVYDPDTLLPLDIKDIEAGNGLAIAPKPAHGFTNNILHLAFKKTDIEQIECFWDQDQLKDVRSQLKNAVKQWFSSTPEAIDQEATRKKVLEEMGRKGGSRNKKNTVLMAGIRHILRSSPDLKYKPISSILRHIRNKYSSSNPLKIANGKLYFNDGKVETVFNGKSKPVSQNTFSKYTADIKKEYEQEPIK
jgi:hypothetical protein